MILNNTAILIISGVIFIVGSIPTLCLCCFTCENQLYTNDTNDTNKNNNYNDKIKNIMIK